MTGLDPTGAAASWLRRHQWLAPFEAAMLVAPFVLWVLP